MSVWAWRKRQRFDLPGPQICNKCKTFMMVLSETLDRFQDLSSVKQVNSKFVFLRDKLKLCVIVNYVDKIMSITLFFFYYYFQGHSRVKQFNIENFMFLYN